MDQPLLVLLLPRRLERFHLEQPVRELLPFQFFLAGALLARHPGAELWYGRPEEELDPELEVAAAARAALTMAPEELLAVAPLRMAELGIVTAPRSAPGG